MKPNTGTLGKNDRKEKDSHPDASGSINVVCPHCDKASDYWLSGWNKESVRGRFYSLALKIKDVIQQKPVAKPEIDDDFIF